MAALNSLVLFIAAFVYCSGVAAAEAAGEIQVEAAAKNSYDNHIGINYGRLANNLPSPEKAVQMLQSTTMRKVKLFDADPAVLKAFANTGLEVTVAFPDDQIYPVGRRPILAYRWIKQNILPFARSGTKIGYISVGNEVLINIQASGTKVADQLVPAMRNLQAALIHYRLAKRTRISTPHALNVLNPSYPPSTGTFRSDLADRFLKPMLQFLNETDSPFMINAYPYFAYRADPANLRLDYALFKPNPGVRDSRTGLHYSNLLDAQVDSVYAAIAALGFPGVRIVVAETGWPSGGAQSEVAATPGYAAAYNGGLVRHVRSRKGTPLRPDVLLEAYIFALFDENLKTGPESEHHYGLFHADMSISYDVGLQRSGTPAAGAPPAAASGPWCVAKSEMSSQQLQTALDWACGPGKADCSAIQPGHACFVPNTLVAHASYAFNNYYQKNGRQQAACVFSGAATVTNSNPSYQGCSYPA